MPAASMLGEKLNAPAQVMRRDFRRAGQAAHRQTPPGTGGGDDRQHRQRREQVPGLFGDVHRQTVDREARQ